MIRDDQRWGQQVTAVGGAHRFSRTNFPWVPGGQVHFDMNWGYNLNDQRSGHILMSQPRSVVVRLWEKRVGQRDEGESLGAEPEIEASGWKWDPRGHKESHLSAAYWWTLYVFWGHFTSCLCQGSMLIALQTCRKCLFIGVAGLGYMEWTCNTKRKYRGWNGNFVFLRWYWVKTPKKHCFHFASLRVGLWVANEVALELGFGPWLPFPPHTPGPGYSSFKNAIQPST